MERLLANSLKYASDVIRRRFLVALVISAASCATLADENAEQYLQRDSVRDYVHTFSAEHDLDTDRIAGMFSRLRRQQSILDAISRPAERTLSWGEYRKIFMTPKRVAGGEAFMEEHAATLQKAVETYGVPAEIITAIIGVETSYGGNTGSYRVLEALATLAFDYPPRSEFFKKEMGEFLILSEGEGWETLEMRGSYAGAMGMPQFIASSYREYAVDFDNDGSRDLFSSHADIIGSVANYLSRHGWQPDAPIAAQWQPTNGVNAQMRQLVQESLQPAVDADTVSELGFSSPTLDAATTDGELVSVMTMTIDGEDELWVGYRNFYAITRYNHSRLYAMAVFQLAEAIRTGA